ncbi:LysR family transcriptional regulator [Acinetobacter lactucae]|uniref:LysR family transcriptional regulator n=1 Tax=Acinetobacter lactucae TaxID=1785128 RepID=UPI0039F73774
MELRHIRYFLVVAEEQNFTRAAARLGISQPPLSMQIKDLEKEIGTDLYFRTSQGVSLTEAGKVFLHSVLPIQQQIENAAYITKQVGDGETGQLRLGFTGTSILNPLVSQSIRIFQQNYPKIDLKLEEANSLLLIDRLLENKLDIAIIRPPHEIPDGLDLHILLSEPLIAAVPAELGKNWNDAISLDMLKDKKFILSPRENSAGLYDAIISACINYGFSPEISALPPQIVSILALVSANLGITMIPQSSQQLHLDGVKYLNLTEPTPTINLALIHRKSMKPKSAINFAILINKHLNEQK